MTTITIIPERSAMGADYRAVAGRRYAVGKTPGEALDAMNAQLSAAESGTIVVVQNLQADVYFTAEQRRRLEALMNLWREARDRGSRLSVGDQAELDALVEAELDAATRRAADLSNGLVP